MADPVGTSFRSVTKQLMSNLLQQCSADTDRDGESLVATGTVKLAKPREVSLGGAELTLKAGRALGVLLRGQCRNVAGQAPAIRVEEIDITFVPEAAVANSKPLETEHKLAGFSMAHFNYCFRPAEVRFRPYGEALDGFICSAVEFASIKTIHVEPAKEQPNFIIDIFLDAQLPSPFGRVKMQFHDDITQRYFNAADAKVHARAIADANRHKDVGPVLDLLVRQLDTPLPPRPTNEKVQGSNHSPTGS